MAEAGAAAQTAALQAYFSGLTEGGVAGQPSASSTQANGLFNSNMPTHNGVMPNFSNLPQGQPSPQRQPPIPPQLQAQLPPAIQLQLAQSSPAQRQAFFNSFSQAAARNLAPGTFQPPGVPQNFQQPSIQQQQQQPQPPLNLNSAAMQNLMNFMQQQPPQSRQSQQPSNLPFPQLVQSQPAQFPALNSQVVPPQIPQPQGQRPPNLTASHIQELLAQGKMTQEQFNNFIRLNMQRRGAASGVLPPQPGAQPIQGNMMPQFPSFQPQPSALPPQPQQPQLSASPSMNFQPSAPVPRPPPSQPIPQAPTFPNQVSPALFEHIKRQQQFFALRKRIQLLEQSLADNVALGQTSGNNNAGQPSRPLTAQERPSYERQLAEDRRHCDTLSSLIVGFQQQNGGAEAVQAQIAAYISHNREAQNAAMLRAQGQPAQPNAESSLTASSAMSTPVMGGANGQRRMGIAPQQQPSAPQSNKPPGSSPAQPFTQSPAIPPVPGPSNLRLNPPQATPQQIGALFQTYGLDDKAFAKTYIAFRKGVVPSAQIQGRDVNLFRLFSLVLSGGGYDQMERTGQWPAIAQSLGLFVDITEASIARDVIAQLSRIYEQNLKDFEAAWISAILRKDIQVKGNTNLQSQSIQPQQQAVWQQQQQQLQQLQQAQQQPNLSNSQPMPFPAVAVPPTMPPQKPNAPSFPQNFDFSALSHQQLTQLGFTEQHIQSMKQGTQAPIQPLQAATVQPQPPIAPPARPFTPSNRPQAPAGEAPAGPGSPAVKLPTSNDLLEADITVRAIADRVMSDRHRNEPLTNLSETDKKRIRETVSMMIPLVKRVRELMPLFLRVSGQQDAVRRFLAMAYLFTDQMQTLEQDVYTLPLEQLMKIKETFEHCTTHLGNRLGPAFAASYDPRGAPPGQENPANVAREALYANLKPGLRVEDLKQPPVKHRRTVSAAGTTVPGESPKNLAGSSPTMLAASPSPSMMTAESPAKVGETPAADSAGSPPKTPRSPGYALRGGRAAARGGTAQRGRRTKSSGGTKFPTSSDIMAEVKQELAAKAGRDPSTVEAEVTATMLAKAAAGVDPLEQRRREIEESKNDPITFAEKSWRALRDAHASAAQASANQTSLPHNGPSTFDVQSFLSQDVAGHLPFDVQPMAPPVIGDLQTPYLLTSPAPGFASGNLLGAPTSAVSPSAAAAADVDFDRYIDPDALEAADTPELVSPSARTGTDGSPNSDDSTGARAQRRGSVGDELATPKMAPPASLPPVVNSLGKRSSTVAELDLPKDWNWDGDLLNSSWALYSDAPWPTAR